MRIGIVDDSVVAIEALRRILRFVPAYQIAWVARDGAEAVDRCARDTPDLVLMDLLMPVMNGVEATRQIMAATPCAVLVVTSSVGANAALVYEAMGHGALDAVDTPSGPPGDPVDGYGIELLAKVATIGKLIRSAPVAPGRAPRTAQYSRPADIAPLVVVGASTGGPAALAAILETLPTDLPFAMVIIQHVDPRFAPGMASWLSTHSRTQVQLAHQGALPRRGQILLSGSEGHLVVDGGLRLAYTPDPIDLPYRPSVDVFFDSVSHHWPTPGAAALLTGMGRDGARGLLGLRAQGWHTIAQDEPSSVVFGMPQAAAKLDAAAAVLPLADIGHALASHFHTRQAG